MHRATIVQMVRAGPRSGSLVTNAHSVCVILALHTPNKPHAETGRLTPYVTTRKRLDRLNAALRSGRGRSGQVGNALRKAYGHAQAAAVDTGPELDASTVALGDALDDRQAQAAAADAAGAAAAIEAVEHALAVLDRNARPAVAHGEHDAARVVGERDIHSAAGGGVTNRVVDQIRDQRA